jgi:squalene-hopene/tetraprenyl-beta-curcumene cyclase
MQQVASDRLARAYESLCESLLAERTADGHWHGELSTSALATATAVMALSVVRRARDDINGRSLTGLIQGGLGYLAANQNPDGGWGDTPKSRSNIATTMLTHAVFHGADAIQPYRTIVDKADHYVRRAGGIDALRARYGKDRTFSVPILTHCALAGLVSWDQVASLPFELACLPHRFYKWLRLPVVSYALPALVAVGQAKFARCPPTNPLVRWTRSWARQPSLDKLAAMMPSSGGFLEAVPLTSFVTMSLAAVGQVEHTVTRAGIEFIVQNVRPDGSWPIERNLSTWVTTLAVNALGPDLSEAAREPILDWILGQQHLTMHPYTASPPGGWAWTDLPGGVPDADDTAGAMLALRHLTPAGARRSAVVAAVERAARWLIELQNADGGWPTFCRGWGALPFDRSASDLTAHAIRALRAWVKDFRDRRLRAQIHRAVSHGRRYLSGVQRANGSWLPLWFGNEACPGDENATYGTCRVLAAYADLGSLSDPAAIRGRRWLIEHQNPDGGWGGGAPTAPSSIEETALAVESLATVLNAQPSDTQYEPLCAPDATTDGSFDRLHSSVSRGIAWLLDALGAARAPEPAPIGFYFAKLWYFERLYPIIFSAAALRQEMRLCRKHPSWNPKSTSHGAVVFGAAPAI